MPRRQTSVHATLGKFPTAKPYYVISQYEHRDSGELRWCVVDNAGDEPTAEASAATRQTFAERNPERHALFLAVPHRELRAMGLGPLIGQSADPLPET